MIVCSYILKKLRKKNPIVISLAFYCIIYLLYYLFEGSSFWYRHFFPAVLAFIIIAPVFIDTVITEKNKIYTAALAIITILLAGNAIFYMSHVPKIDLSKKVIEQNLIFFHEKSLPFTAPDPLLRSQLQTADYVKNDIPINSSIAGISWWNAPEIAYLARRNIGRDPFITRVSYVITDYYGNLLGTNDYEYLALIKNKTELFHYDGYTIYKKQ
jgi:hypothetical protein